MKTIKIYFLLCPLLFCISCTGLLDEKPDLALITPDSIEDLRALLDNSNQVMNAEPGLAEAATDNVLLLQSALSVISPYQRNTYLWERDMFEGMVSSGDWNRPFQQVLYANIVLYELDRIPGPEKQTEAWKALAGSALFYRAYAYFGLARQFTMPYTEADAPTTMGLPLRTNTAVADPPERSSLAETFDLILGDLNTAAPMLPDIDPNMTRPSKAAAFAMLSRVYLYMGMYDESLDNADKALALRDGLLDYNTLDVGDPWPFVQMDEEVLFYSQLNSYSFYYFRNDAVVDTALVASYRENDLRRDLFFKPSGDYFTFKGQISPTLELFGGLATDELYLNKAECEARLGRAEAANQTLHKLLETRYRQGTYLPEDIMDPAELLEKVLLERRKQLLMRNIRWGDLKRLNNDPITQKVLVRETGEGTVHLEPGDPRYAFPIPDNEISAGDIEQNPR